MKRSCCAKAGKLHRLIHNNDAITRIIGKEVDWEVENTVLNTHKVRAYMMFEMNINEVCSNESFTSEWRINWISKSFGKENMLKSDVI